MSVKHVSASKTPGLQAANPRRIVNIAAARPAQKSTVVPGESKAPTEGELAIAQALQTEPKAAAAGAPPHVETPSEAANAAAELLNAVEPAPAPPPARASAAVDYYAIISRTIEGLALNNVETRIDVYEHARAVVQQRLKDAGPAMSSHMVAVEQTAFDRAIKKIEAEQLEHQFARAAAGAKAVREHAVPVAATAEVAAPASKEAVPPGETETQDRAPTIVIAKRPKPAPPIRQMHGGTLRLFAVIGLVIAGFFGYWLTTGKPNLVGLRNITHIVTKAPQASGAHEENTNAAFSPVGTEPAEQQTPGAAATAALSVPAASTATAQTSPAAALSDEDVTSPSAYNIQLATFLSLCRPARTAYGDDPCGNLQPRPFGGPGVTPRKAPEWVAMYASLSETIPARRVKKPVFTAPALPAQASAGASANDAAPVRTANATARERYTRGIDLAKNDNLEGAVSDFSEAIRLDPKFTDAYVQRGQAMFKNGNAERAIADFSQALQIDPRNAPAFKARGMAMLYKGDDDGAIVDLTKAIQYAEIDPSIIPSIEVFYARRSRASLYDRKQLYDRELIDLTAMIDGYWRDPSLAAALKNTYREQGAAALVATIYRLRSGVHQKRANLDAAIGDLSFALQLDPSRTLQFLIERGRLLETAGRREQATTDYQQALELSPNNTDVRNSLARLKGRN